MAEKNLTFDADARKALLSGVEKLSAAVKCTLGPRGRNAVIDKSWGGPTVTKDGVTVAEEIEFRDKVENMGAQLVKEAASKTSEDAGDGTTTTTVLAEALFRGGLKHIAAGVEANALVRGMHRAIETVVDEIKAAAQPVGDNIAAVAAISALAVGLVLGYIVFRQSLAATIGMTCGAMTSTPGLGVATAQFDSDAPALAYAAVYPIALVAMTLAAQFLLACLG